MQNTFQSRRSHIRYKLKQQEKPIKLKPFIACIV